MKLQELLMSVYSVIHQIIVISEKAVIFNLYIQDRSVIFNLQIQPASRKNSVPGGTFFCI